MPSPHLDIRTTDEVLQRLDRLAAAMNRPGVDVSRSAAARAALLRGLDALEAEYGVTAKKGTKPARQPKK